MQRILLIAEKLILKLPGIVVPFITKNTLMLSSAPMMDTAIWSKLSAIKNGHEICQGTLKMGYNINLSKSIIRYRLVAMQIVLDYASFTKIQHELGAFFIFNITYHFMCAKSCVCGFKIWSPRNIIKAVIKHCQYNTS